MDVDTPPKADLPPPRPPTPIVPKTATSVPYTSTHVNRDENMTNIGYEISGKILGPMPANTFLESFLPCNAAPSPAAAVDKVALRQVMTASSESQMYEPFSTNSRFGSHNTSFQEFQEREIKPDICLIFEPERPREAIKQSVENVGIMAEFKHVALDDPFDDDSPTFERNTSQARDTLGQICTYATAHAAAQFRTHVFSLLVFPKYARLLIWDRSGVIVTEKIDFEEHVSVLADFFWRYQHMTPGQRGHDETIKEILEAEREKVLAAVPTALTLLGANDDSRLYSISFPHNREFVISASASVYMGTGSPIGRSTRTFKALCLQTKRIVFLKDTWRVVSPGLLPEHEVYGKLVEAGVRHVATLETFDDIISQVTRTQEFHSKSWVNFEGPRRFRTLQHYRLVLREFASPIQSFRNVKQLIQVFRDALEAHYDAHDRARILHRDISVGNIMITGEGRGLLIDWDLSKSLDTPEFESPPERTGTWQFMAARLIQQGEPSLPTPNRDDDLESFWLVLLWVVLRHCKHHLSDNRILHSLRTLFDSAYLDAGQQQGGDSKLSELKSRTIIEKMHLDNPLLFDILSDTATILAARYPQSNKIEKQVLEVEEIWTKFESENPDLPTSELEDKFVLKPVFVASYPIWKGRKTLGDTQSQWAVAVFDAPLNDPNADWDAGGANITRTFPRNASQGLKRKRESEINNFQ